MLKCNQCGKRLVKFKDKPYVCSYCGGTYCINHHLPENHKCYGFEKNIYKKIKEIPGEIIKQPKLEPEIKVGLIERIKEFFGK